MRRSKFRIKCYRCDQTQSYGYSLLVFYYSLRHVSTVQITHHQVGVGYIKRNIKEDISMVRVLCFYNFRTYENNYVRQSDILPVLSRRIVAYLIFYVSTRHVRPRREMLVKVNSKTRVVSLINMNAEHISRIAVQIYLQGHACLFLNC